MNELFPGAGDAGCATLWTGLRPATPSNVPCIGRTRYPNLYLDTGHGTLGWTHACGSGQAIADIVSGRTPGVDFAFAGDGGGGRYPARLSMVSGATAREGAFVTRGAAAARQRCPPAWGISG